MAHSSYEDRLQELSARLVGLESEDIDDAEELVGELRALASSIEGEAPAAIGKLLLSAAVRLEAVAHQTAKDGDAALLAVGKLLEVAAEARTESVPALVSEVPSPLEAATPLDVPSKADAVEPEPDVRHRVIAAEVAKSDDPELLAEFVEECRENLSLSEQALLELEAHPESKEDIDTVFRAFHTIKGVSAFLELISINTLAHSAENLLSRMRDGEIRCTGGYANLALRAVDMQRALTDCVAAAAKGEPIDDPVGIDELRTLLSDPEANGVDAEGGAVIDLDEAEPAVATALDSGKGKAAEPFVRIATDRLDRLLDAVGELVIAHSMVGQDPTLSEPEHIDLQRKVGHAGKIVRELQDLSMSLRMVPLRATFKRLGRVVRDVARKQSKLVEYVVEGEETQIDRNMVDVLSEPLVHMIRNSVDHGVEAPERRAGVGKPEVGIVKVSACHEGGHVVVSLQDDGKGLDRDAIFSKAVERGLVNTDDVLTDEAVFKLVFEPGFSTAEKVTDVSGRGVGMDVVKRAIEKLKGRVSITSELGVGTTFKIYMPLTLAITDGILVKVGQERYLIPTDSIRQSLRPEADDIYTVSGRGEMLVMRGETIPIFRLHQIFGVEDAVESLREGLLVIVGQSNGACALLVDELFGQHQVVTKSLGDGIGNVPGISGGAILGDGRVGLIVDPVGVARLARETASFPTSLGVAAA